MPRVLAFGGHLVMKPLVVVENWVIESGGAIPTYLRDRTQILKEQKVLEQSLVEERAGNVALHKLELENAELRKLLGGTNDERIVAGIVGRPSLLPYDVLVIDRGADQGVVNDVPVYVGQHQVIGFVTEVYKNSSVVALVTTPGFESTAYIYGPNIYTTAEGVGGGTLRVSVPQGIELKEGNLVVLPALDAGIYGSISVVDSIATRPEQYGYVTMGVPLKSLHFVGVSKEPLLPLDFEQAKAVVDQVRRDFLEIPVPESLMVDVPVDIATSTASTSAEEI